MASVDCFTVPRYLSRDRDERVIGTIRVRGLHPAAQVATRMGFPRTTVAFSNPRMILKRGMEVWRKGATFEPLSSTSALQKWGLGVWGKGPTFAGPFCVVGPRFCETRPAPAKEPANSVPPGGFRTAAGRAIRSWFPGAALAWLVSSVGRMRCRSSRRPRGPTAGS